MEEAPLNKAHQEYRAAEKHLRYRRFNEAIQCHQKAATYLQEAMQHTANTKAYESLQSQYEYHLQQQNFIRIKQLEHNTNLKAENQRRQLANMVISHDTMQNTDSLQFAIFKTMNQADSLLGLLTYKDETDHISVAKDEVDFKTESNLQIQMGTKKPKGDEMVIEELKILNGQLHKLVSKLVGQLEHKDREIESLNDKIKVLEAEKLASRCVMNTSNLAADLAMVTSLKPKES